MRNKNIEDQFAKDLSKLLSVKVAVTSVPNEKNKKYVFTMTSPNGQFPAKFKGMSREFITDFLFREYGALIIDSNRNVIVKDQADDKIITAKTISIPHEIMKQIDKDNVLTKEEQISAIITTLQRFDFAELVAAMLLRDKSIELFSQKKENKKEWAAAEKFSTGLTNVCYDNEIDPQTYASALGTFVLDSKFKQQNMPELYKIENHRNEKGEIVNFSYKPIENNHETFRALLDCDDLRNFLAKNLMKLYTMANRIFVDARINCDEVKRPQKTKCIDNNENIGFFPSQDNKAGFPLVVVGINEQTRGSIYAPRDGWKIKEPFNWHAHKEAKTSEEVFDKKMRPLMRSPRFYGGLNEPGKEEIKLLTKRDAVVRNNNSHRGV
jgi:hypothetical protein